VDIGFAKKNRALNSTIQISETRHMYCNFKYPRWVKLGTLLFGAVNKLKLTILIHQGKKHQNKYSLARANKT
jgi:hypothetical protein